jgi:hypothetical protein
MTEAQWLACTDPDRMLQQLLGRGTTGGLLALFGFRRDRGPEWHYRASERKVRLFAVNCCSRIRSLLLDERSWNAVQACAAYADGQAGEQQLRAAQAAAWAATQANTPGIFAEYVSVAGGSGTPTGKSQFWAARAAAEAASPDIDEVVRSVSDVERAAIQAATETWSAEAWAAAIGAAVRADLVREIFGNPFRPSPPLPEAVLAWNDGTVRRIAEGAYADRAPERLPILGDALLDAGCDDEELIQHCRSGGPHVIPGCWAVDLILGKP